MNNNCKIIFHIGMPRTATTFLQKNIFPKLKNVNFINTGFYQHRLLTPELKKANETLLNLSRIPESTIKKNIDSYLVMDKINLFSREQIYSDAGLNPMKNESFEKRVKKIKKLKNIYPNSKIIFGIRNKDSLLKSYYIKYVMNGGTLLFSDYASKIQKDNRLNYDEYVKQLISLFSKDNVYIYKFENLVKSRGLFVKELCEFIGTDIPIYENIKRNKSYGKNRILLSLLLNRLFIVNNDKQGFINIRSHGLLPHRLIFMSKIFNNYPKNRIDIIDLEKIENQLSKWNFMKN